MRFLNNLPWIALGGLMILHGIAHSPAILGSWKFATFEDVSFQPNFLLTNVSDSFVYVLGFFWLMAAISFIVAGIGVLRHSAWWPMLTGVALVLSLAMTMLWRQDAVVGLTLNAILLAVLGGMYMIGQFEQRRLA